MSLVADDDADSPSALAAAIVEHHQCQLEMDSALGHGTWGIGQQVGAEVLGEVTYSPSAMLSDGVPKTPMRPVI